MPPPRAQASPAAGAAAPQSIIDLARQQAAQPKTSGGDGGSNGGGALRRLYAFTAGTARCHVGPALAAKYGMEEDNTQTVVSVTNRATLEQAWFNEVRTRKPQTFKASAALLDPTDGGRKCDFCRWQELTAVDSWGRIEGPHAVTGSNLFKYGEPAHGLVLFKHHDPLAFTHAQLHDFLSVSAAWFAAAAAAHPDNNPFFIWNCGARAGASQFHGHGQLLLTDCPVPAQVRLDREAAAYAATHAGATTYYADVLEAHEAAGLARVVGSGADRAWLVAHMAPSHDMEVLVLGSALDAAAFATALHAALRAFIDRLGVQTFNCGVLNLGIQASEDGAASAAPGAAAAAAAAAARADGANGGARAHGAGGASEAAPARASGAGGAWWSRSGAAALAHAAGGGGAGWRPVMARLVSRGKITSPASDYGCLEVVGNASIGDLDPFLVVRAIDEQLDEALGPERASSGALAERVAA